MKMMKKYRITKYDPAKRNEKGHYLDSTEWTSISDIGKAEYNSPTYSDYEKIENSYVESINEILKINQILELEISGLESYNTKQDFEEFKKNERLINLEVNYETEIKTLTEGTIVKVSSISKFVRLILRETIWMKLLSPKCNLEFGYDYYMYVQCKELSKKTIKTIEGLGLYVES
jgi:hypothetical protein